MEDDDSNLGVAQRLVLGAEEEEMWDVLFAVANSEFAVVACW